VGQTDPKHAGKGIRRDDLDDAEINVADSNYYAVRETRV
jgi:hypothetical protein